MKKLILMAIFAGLSLWGCDRAKEISTEEVKAYFESKEFKFENIFGIGYEKGVTRRDNSDVIKVNGKYYVYYTKVFGKAAGYWGTIWASVSEDEGKTWTELGEVLSVGANVNWDSQAVFTPNILKEGNTYYLYYTGVQPTPTNPDRIFENNSVNDYTAIGVAKSDSPEGPFVRCKTNPIIEVSKAHNLFDSYRVDDAVMLKKDNKFWLYYKGRKYEDGKSGPAHTQMGVAFADNPEGPFKKYKNNPILDKSHEVFLWKQNIGIACLSSISCTFEFAPDGLDFLSDPVAVNVVRNKRPNATGAYRPDLSGLKENNELSWGISMVHNGNECYLVRWELIDKNTY